MQKIPLTQGKFALVDERDFAELSKYKWSAEKRGKIFYASRYLKKINGEKTRIRMHTEIKKSPHGKEIDHIDRNGLNNQRSNLRICTRAENERNKLERSDNKSGFKGVCWSKQYKKWRSRIQCNGKEFHLGYFKDKIKACETYIKYCKIYHGKFARFKKTTGL